MTLLTRANLTASKVAAKDDRELGQLRVNPFAFELDLKKKSTNPPDSPLLSRTTGR